MTPEARKAYQGQLDAENMQPWRCVACNTAVRPGFNDPCKCFPELSKTAK